MNHKKGKSTRTGSSIEKGGQGVIVALGRGKKRSQASYGRGGDEKDPPSGGLNRKPAKKRGAGAKKERFSVSDSP